ncbi:MAG: Histidine ammonia-lyase [Candidatus Celerinatantimonas neptuna]|nr:MAG: Histidine ammonia-lyase [Candidatus Celerinatantimonas neptuna]
MSIIIHPGHFTLDELRQIAVNRTPIVLEQSAYPIIKESHQTVKDILASGETVYGINTGFGLLARTSIPDDSLAQLQKNLLLSHAAGTGPLLDDNTVALIMALKIGSLARGFSGVRVELIEQLLTMYNKGIYPCIPSQGSVGASGDLAPLAHMACAMIGVGEVRVDGQIKPAEQGLRDAEVPLLELGPKEGLALINGTQTSTALALQGLFGAERVYSAAVTAGALSVEALKGSYVPFDSRIAEVRGQLGQIRAAEHFRSLLTESEINQSHRYCDRVQDPYSLRCQPQVMGACLDQINHSAKIILREANAVSDNPLIFKEQGDVLSGGNFHAEPVAIAADNLAIAISEIGALSERRIAQLVDPAMSGLPAFLVKESGLNSGFMIAQVSAAALASENKSLAHPGSVDSLPTSANQEDHVSMATYAARRLTQMAGNSAAIVGIEILAAAQGIEFHTPLKPTKPLQEVMQLVRSEVDSYDQDRFIAPDIAKARALVETAALQRWINAPSLYID